MQVITLVFMALSLCALFFFMVKRSPNCFGKERKRSVDVEHTKAKFEDVDGVEEAKQETIDKDRFLAVVSNAAMKEKAEDPVVAA